MPNGNIPNAGQRTVRAEMKVKSFVSPSSPDAKALEAYDAEVNKFLLTIDNQKRFLNGRNAYSIGDKVYTLVWYLERVPEEPVTTPFGKGVTPAQPVMKEDAKPESPEEKKA